jgi:hypothetical protein
MFDIRCSFDITLATVHTTMTLSTFTPHYSTRLYSDSNNKREESLSEPIHNQYHHTAIIITTTTLWCGYMAGLIIFGHFELL